MTTRFFSLLTTNFSRIGKDNYYILLALKKKQYLTIWTHSKCFVCQKSLFTSVNHFTQISSQPFIFWFTDEYQKLLQRKQSFMASHLSLLICMVLHEWIIADVDDRTALKNLVSALKDLTSNNFRQAVLTLGCVGMGANLKKRSSPF